MSTNPTPKNILCLKNLALNILKNSIPEIITKGVEVPELDPCSKCKKELFLYELKKPFTILICGHIYHRSCLEDYVKNLPQCPECAMEIESIDYTCYSGTSEPSSQDQAQNTSDPMQISPQMTQMTQMTSSQSGDIVTSDTTHSLNLPLSDFFISDYTKQKLKSNTAEQNTDKITSYQVIATETDLQSIDFLNLYTKITFAESENQKQSQKVIIQYYNFGIAIAKRFKFHYEKTYNVNDANSEVNKEIEKQLPDSTPETTIRKRKERTQKIFHLFSKIGIDKIMRVNSFSALMISKLTVNQINHVISQIPDKTPTESFSCVEESQDSASPSQDLTHRRKKTGLGQSTDVIIARSQDLTHRRKKMGLGQLLNTP
ncbi:980_t:CDS:2 [Cetraspora pellucida]|uniref:980_t:CDS:1 n=1 Tax=Cetraspora pellucida TaxID=1433469 RepID=A0A9N9HC41_9GLOM|nr:980_t:CDS:2 [Cetraspora pellucida]